MVKRTMISPAKYWKITEGRQENGMQEKEILTSQEKQQLNEYCADEIYQYGRNYMKLIKVFESYGYRMPVECWHNFRDSWFHYRKLYTRKERISILNEKYAMEEHLLRAWKDAIIFLLQEISWGLEFWYAKGAGYHGLEASIDAEAEKIVNEVHKKAQETNMKQFNWSKAIVDGYGQVDERIRYQCCYFYYKKFISSKEMDKVLQKLLHSLKDLILLIRYSGTKIQRPNDPYEYMQRLLDLLDEINDKLNKDGAIFLISIGTVVSGSMDK